jgi:hypothetical protein
MAKPSELSYVVSDYRLEDQGSILGRAKDFSSSLCVQTCSDAHSTSYPMGKAPFQGVQTGRGVTLTAHSYLVPR